MIVNDRVVPEKMVVYYRLSRKKKGRTKTETIDDAYGIEVQRRLVERLRAENSAKIVAEYSEIETGTNKKNRPTLQEAIAHTKRIKGTLCIAKLDRLARNTHFVTGLQDSKVEFICADDPTANTLTIQIKAAVAEEEARTISRRTRECLAVARDNGVLLGSARPGHWKDREHLRLKGAKSGNKASAKIRAERAREAYTFFIGPIRELRDSGHTLGAIADKFNTEGHLTTRQKPFTATAILRVIRLFDEQERKANFGLRKQKAVA